MTVPEEPDPAASRQEKENRNAALRGRIDDMLSDLRRRTGDLRDKQAEAARRSHEVTSEDGVVTARVDATGTLQELTLADKAFDRVSPERLARTITSVVREASGGAQQTLRTEFEALAQAPDPADIAPGFSGMSDLFPSGPLVEPPDPAAERTGRAESEASSRRNPRRQADTGDTDEDPPDSFMAGGRW